MSHIVESTTMTEAATETEASPLCFSLDDLEELEEDEDDRSYSTEIFSEDSSLSQEEGATCAVVGVGAHQELLDLKLQIVKQRGRIDKLLSRLERSGAANVALAAENAVLVKKLSLAARERPDEDAWVGWFSKQGFAGKNNGYGGSMQMLVDANAKLMVKNSRLEVALDVVHKSFQNYILDSRRKSAKAKLLRRKNEVLTHALGARAAELSPKPPHSLIQLTAMTSFESCPPDENGYESPFDSFCHSMIEDSTITSECQKLGVSGDVGIGDENQDELPLLDTSGDEWIADGGDAEAASDNSRIGEDADTGLGGFNGIQNALDKGTRVRGMLDFFVDFEEGEEALRQRRDTASSSARLSRSLGSAGLLVDFGECRTRRRRRQRSTATTDRLSCSLPESSLRRKSAEFHGKSEHMTMGNSRRKFGVSRDDEFISEGDENQDADPVDSPDHSIEDGIPTGSNLGQTGISGDLQIKDGEDFIIGGGNEVEDASDEGAFRGMSAADLLVDFGERSSKTQHQHSAADSTTRLCRSLTEVNLRGELKKYQGGKSEELLVNFGENRRPPRSMARSWSCLKLHGVKHLM